MSQNTKPHKFDLEKVQSLASEMAKSLTGSGLSSVEMAYAVASVLRGVGEATYDRESVESEDVLNDYRTSPSWSGALILHADQVHGIYELFSQEAKDPEVNKKAWKAHEEQFNVNE